MGWLDDLLSGYGYQPLPSYAQFPTFDPNTAYNPLRGPTYTSLQDQWNAIQGGGSALPPGYRQAVMQRAMSDLGAQQQLQQSQINERMNAMGLLGSGALGTAYGLLGQQYARSARDVENALTEQELGERARIQEQLYGYEQGQAGRDPYLRQMALQQGNMRAQAQQARLAAERASRFQAALYSRLSGQGESNPFGPGWMNYGAYGAGAYDAGGRALPTGHGGGSVMYDTRPQSAPLSHEGEVGEWDPVTNSYQRAPAYRQGMYGHPYGQMLGTYGQQAPMSPYRGPAAPPPQGYDYESLARMAGLWNQRPQLPPGDYVRRRRSQSEAPDAGGQGGGPGVPFQVAGVY